MHFFFRLQLKCIYYIRHSRSASYLPLQAYHLKINIKKNLMGNMLFIQAILLKTVQGTKTFLNLFKSDSDGLRHTNNNRKNLIQLNKALVWDGIQVVTGVPPF